jgi:catechol 2,3-dioxygenase-like lactoylglutathione lyase family enzyme
MSMITGTHTLIFSEDAAAVRTFLRDTLGFDHVDAGAGWLIFALPPAELAVHPAGADAAGRQQLWLMCDDLTATMAELRAKGVSFRHEPQEAGFGRTTEIELPDGSTLGLYEPRHPTAI